MKRHMTWWSTEFEVLAIYNAEVRRGIMHTPEYKAQMEEYQRKYNEAVKKLEDDLLKAVEALQAALAEEE